MLSRQVIDALLPPGAIWTPSDDGDLDKLLEGKATTDEETQEFLAQLSLLRDPLRTPDLDSLELEYGIQPDNTVDETIRRERLLSVKVASPGDGTAETLQRILRGAGFDVYVHENSPAVDPNLFLFDSAGSVFGNGLAIFGNENAMFGGRRGDLVVNGPTYEHLFVSGAVFGGLRAVFGNESAVFYSGAGFEQELIEYTLPSDPGYWPLIFFVGGPATRGANGELTEIEDAEVPFSRRDEFVATIVKHKPVHSWAGLIIKYV